MTVVYMDLCHECDRPIVGGVFCADCLLIADVLASASSEPVRLLSSATPLAGAGCVPARAPETGSLDSAAGSTASSRRGSRHERGGASSVAPAASINKNTRRRSAFRAASTGAYNHGG